MTRKITGTGVSRTGTAAPPARVPGLVDRGVAVGCTSPGRPRIKSDSDLAHIPVVILTTSSSEEDVLRSYKLHANAYVTKPVDVTQFIAAVRQIDEFFVSVVRLPRQ